jgi:hypothetical protein
LQAKHGLAAHDQAKLTNAGALVLPFLATCHIKISGSGHPSHSKSNPAKSSGRENKVKPIKMLVLAVAAALLAMAFVGAGAAMAESTALCNVDPALEPGEECPAGHLITHVHETTLTGEKGKLLSSSLNVECDVLFLGDVTSTNNLGAPLKIKGASGVGVHSFTYTNCNSGCVVTEENGPVELEVLKEGHETAKVTGKGLVHVECSGFINCRYTGTGLVGTGVGPLLSTNLLTGHVILTEQTTTKESGTLCPTTAKLDLNLHPLTHTYIGS